MVTSMDEAVFFRDATALASQIRSGQLSAMTLIPAFLDRISSRNPELNAYTLVTINRALNRARDIDRQVAAGLDPGPLAGVPFAVKNLYDIDGYTTLAGARINADNPPAQRDALLIQRLEAAGAVLLGALNMGEYAYDFTGENCHYGNCHNPWRRDHMSGGSSSGSGSAGAAGLAPIALGSDTNGSIRVPASLCGLFGLKPTYGRLPRTGTYPFCDSLDHLGPLARSARDLALTFDVLQGADHSDHACAGRATLPTRTTLALGAGALRMARLGGHFATAAWPQADAAMDKVCRALDIRTTVEWPLAAAARAAAYLITNCEGSALHLPRLQTRLQDFDPDTRDRFVAGTALPAQWYIRAQQVRQHCHQAALELFRHTDILLAPATPCTAPPMGTKWLTINGEPQLLRPNLGLFTQPVSAIGLPSVVVPTLDEDTGMPIGVQIIAAPWREDLCLRIAQALEAEGFAARQPPAWPET